MNDPLFTCFPTQPAVDEIPSVILSPFSGNPHPLAKQAALILQQQLATEQLKLRDPSTDLGKMFGVLVVQESDGRIGFLSAFSGQLHSKWEAPGFVPPIFDPTEHDSFLPAGKAEAIQLAKQLQKLEQSSRRSELVQNIAQLKQQSGLALAELRQSHKDAKAVRKQQRLALQELSEEKRQSMMKVLALASQQHKREFTNASIHWQEKIQCMQVEVDEIEQQIRQIKELRVAKSRQLHKRMFSTYLLHNYLDEIQPISDFFDDGFPPAGAGDCAGPKLIHYAHQHGLQPLALAEFWWGPSPSTGVRHHGQFYPACRGKCHPILPFMLRGIAVEAEPDYGQEIAADEPLVIFEDDNLLVVNKPAGLMSAPGKHIKDSVFNRLIKRYPDHPELRLVHRLDMATSGLLLVAKTLRANKFLQRQFIQHTVEKRYEALLNRRLTPDLQQGEINLPLRVDLDDRPRQLVCFEHGKEAITHWQLIGQKGESTRIWFYPKTGRTHQLRVHASHRDGLNAAIVGDALYGQPAERLMLHAQRLCFTHPVSRERMEFELPAPF